MNVTLTSYDQGGWDVRRGTERWVGRVIVLATFDTWEVHWLPDGMVGQQAPPVAGGFRKLRDARAWLDGTDGQVWLDFLPRQP